MTTRSARAKAAAEPPSLAMVVAARMRHARRVRGWSQADLAAKTGFAQPTIGAWERCGRRMTLEALEAIAGAFGVPVKALLPDTGPCPNCHGEHKPGWTCDTCLGLA